MRWVNVELGTRSYRIAVGSGLLPRLGAWCKALELGRRCAVVSDASVGPRYAEGVLGALSSAGFEPALVEVPAGEGSKSLAQVGRCYSALARHRLERKSFIVALGGGVVGDLAGFLAATYLRGMAFVQVPTTLLAQVDSSVGGKVGVNLPEGKNLVGAFHQPRLVVCDIDTLKTLPPREFKAGLAEVIKYGIIHDPGLFRRLERDLDRLLGLHPSLVSSVVARCCEIKAEVVSQDETETGLRAILNFGHTIGHAIEAVSGYGRYLHGEAISIGQVAAARLSVTHHGLSVGECERIERLFRRAGLPVDMPMTAARRRAILGAMALDKKVASGQVKFVLARKIGAVDWGNVIPAESVEAALKGVTTPARAAARSAQAEG